MARAKKGEIEIIPGEAPEQQEKIQLEEGLEDTLATLLPEQPPLSQEVLRNIKLISPDANGGRWPSRDRLFISRMKREGKYPQYNERVAELVKIDKEAGGSGNYGAMMRVAANEFGILDKAHEIVLAERYINEHQNPVVVPLPQKAVTYQELRCRSFERTLEKLPKNVDKETEVDWIRQHPAMTRKVRTDSKKDLKLTASDLKGAPSRASVIALQYWINNPAEFFKRVLTADAKRQTDTAEQQYDVRVDTAEIESLLQDLG